MTKSPLIIGTIETEAGKLYVALSHSNPKPSSDYWPGEKPAPHRSANVSYFVVSEDGRDMVEVEPFYGPFTYIHAEDVLQKYRDRGELDRGCWAQQQFDRSGFVEAAHRGDVDTMARILHMELCKI